MTGPGWRAWIDAAAGLFLHHKLAPRSTSVLPDAEATFQHLLVLAKAQGGTELAFERHRECLALSQSRTAADLGLVVRHSLEVHSLLVSANLFWNTLDGLAKQIPSFPELSRTRQQFVMQQQEARMARDHIEHMTERTVYGRNARWPGGSMSVDDFRRAVGKIDDDTIAFGREVFDLSGIASAVSHAGNRVAAALAKNGFPMPGLIAKVSPPASSQE